MPEDLYRIEFTVQRRRECDEDFIDIGFGSSGGWPDVDQAAYTVMSMIDNRQWETEAGMPEPGAVEGDPDV